jgi:hypothetical protein
MRKITSIILGILPFLLLIAMFLISYGYKGPAPIEGDSSVDIQGIAIIAFLWICYMIYKLNKRVENLEMKQKNGIK